MKIIKKREIGVRCMRICAYVGFFLLLGVFPLRADVIVFQDDQVLNGTIISQNEEETVIDIGAGTIAFPTTSIKNVTKGSAVGENVILGEPLDEKTKEQRKIRKLLSIARRKRRIVKRLQSQKLREERILEKMSEGVSDLYKKYEEASTAYKHHVSINRGKRVSPSVNRRSASLVAIVNESMAAVKLKEAEIAKQQKQIDEINLKLSEALAELNAGVAALEEGYTASVKADPTLKGDPLFESMKNTIHRVKDDWITERIPLNVKGNSFSTSVKLNDSLSYEFIVDTGCSTTVITRAIADALGLTKDDEVMTVKHKIADGSMVEGKLVYLEQISVHGMSAYNVPASIIDAIEGHSIHPLLGMSYLKNFYFQLDAQARTLILKKLKE